MILEVDNVELSFRNKQILNGIYIQGKKGKVTGILGRNGSGKSSLLQIIFGNLTPQNKLIRINKQPKTTSLYLSKNIKYLPQHNLFPKRMKIQRAFYLFDADWDSFISIFQSFRIYKNSRIRDLSGGEKRVLETFLALKSPGDIVLLDEPFSNISPIYAEIFSKLITEEKEHKIIIVTDHMYRHIVSISDELYLLHNSTSTLIKNKEQLIQYGYLAS